MKIGSFIVQYVSEKEWIVCKGYRFYKYYPDIGKMEYFSKVVDDKNALLSRFRLIRRFFRAEITHLYHFQNNNWMCIGRKALFKLNHTTGLFEKCATIAKGSRPMNLCQAIMVSIVITLSVRRCALCSRRIMDRLGLLHTRLLMVESITFMACLLILILGKYG